MKCCPFRIVYFLLLGGRAANIVQLRDVLAHSASFRGVYGLGVVNEMLPFSYSLLFALWWKCGTHYKAAKRCPSMFYLL